METYILSVTAKAEQIPFYTPLSGLVTGSYLTPITLRGIFFGEVN